jgi:hypothetical protein
MVTTRNRGGTKKEDKDPKVDTPTPKRSQRQRRKEELKSKNTGVGLKISKKEPSISKKIVFDEDHLPDIVEEKEDQADAVPAPELASGDDDDDDDAVEEVGGQAAREKVLEQMKSEENQGQKSKKKKKRKERRVEEAPKEKDDEDEELDEDFFAQLETLKEQQAKEQQQASKGKHTTFVFQQQEQENSDTSPKQVDHNIQVVVLKSPAEETTATAISAVPTNALSEEALMYSRSRLVDGSDSNSGAPGSARSGGKRKHKQPEAATWKRSKKMNHLAGARSRINRRGDAGRAGMAAANFAKKR